MKKFFNTIVLILTLTSFLIFATSCQNSSKPTENTPKVPHEQADAMQDIGFSAAILASQKFRDNFNKGPEENIHYLWEQRGEAYFMRPYNSLDTLSKPCEIVVSGEVLTSEKIPFENNASYEEYNAFTFKVEEVYKGNVNKGDVLDFLESKNNTYDIYDGIEYAKSGDRLLLFALFHRQPAKSEAPSITGKDFYYPIFNHVGTFKSTDDSDVYERKVPKSEKEYISPMRLKSTVLDDLPSLSEVNFNI